MHKRYRKSKARKFIEKIRRGSYWFTFVTTSGVEPTNNRQAMGLRVIKCEVCKKNDADHILVSPRKTGSYVRACRGGGALFLLEEMPPRVPEVEPVPEA